MIIEGDYVKEYIGIIVKNQWDNILLYDKSFYMKVEINENKDKDKDIKVIIKEEIVKNLNKDIFKIRKVYEEKLEHRYETLTMYLVEVGIYTDDFEFIKIEKLAKEIYSFQDKEFFEKNILRYEEYNTFLISMFNLFIVIFIVDILPKINVEIDIKYFFSGLSIIALSIILFKNMISPKISKYMTKFKLNIKIANFIIIITLIIYCIKIIK